MRITFPAERRWGRWGWAATAALITACGGGSGSGSSNGGGGYGGMPPPPTQSAYTASSLVSDGAVTAATTDTNLVNPWGIVFAPGAPVWISNNGTQTSTLYDGTGVKEQLVVNIPAGTNGDADPTGIVFNGVATDFVVTEGANSAAAKFIFDGEGGTITGWSPSVDLTNAIIMYDDGAGGAVYKGLAIATDGSGAQHLYAADFHNNKVDVFDKTFAKVTATGGFTDSTLPTGYAPFGIQALTVNNQTLIYVSYAMQKAPDNHDNTNGAGLGIVDVYDTSGTLKTHLIAAGGKLNAPWGMTLAPANFGTLSNELLVGNFGDGWINAFDPTSGAFVASLSDANGNPFAVPGLWGIAFGNGAANQPTTTLYFAAGITDEAHGEYGRIDLGATAPDIVAPTATITAPAASAQVSGTVALTATASDNVAVASVSFFAGTTLIGTATTSPYTVNWDTTQATNGTVSLTAQAKDAAGNVGTSAAVSVTVSNVAPPPVTLTQLQTTIFTPICSGCHTGVGAGLPGSMNLTSGNAFAALVNVASVEQPTLMRVKPNDPDNSYIVQKLEGAGTISGSRMPLGGPFLDQATINMVRTWISQGAQNN